MQGQQGQGTCKNHTPGIRTVLAKPSVLSGAEHGG